MHKPAPDTLRRLLSYDALTGRLVWRWRDADLFSAPIYQKIWNTKNAGKAIERVDGKGYGIVSVFGQTLRAHRVILAMETGEWPDGEVDHIDGNRTNNALGNLRIVTRQQNNRNARQPKTNTSGCVGVYSRRRYGDWIAAIGVDGKSQHIGVFPTYDEAVAARKAAERNLGFHSNHARIA